MSAAVRFAAAFAALYAAHQVGDHHVQRDGDAQAKGKAGVEGRRACARHVASYTATAAVALAATEAVTRTGFRPGRVAAALALSAVTHYVIDRREPLRRFAEATGHGGFYALGQPRPGRDDNPTLGTGAYALDQSAHVGCLFVDGAYGASTRAGRQGDRQTSRRRWRNEMGRKNRDSPPPNKADEKANHVRNCERLTSRQDTVTTLAQQVGHEAAMRAARDVLRHRAR